MGRISHIIAGVLCAATAIALPGELVVLSDKEVRPDEGAGLYYLGSCAAGYLYNGSSAAVGRVAPHRILDRDAQTKDYYIVWAPEWVKVAPVDFAHLGTAVRLSEYEILVGIERGFGPGALRAVEHRIELIKLTPVTPVDLTFDGEAPPAKKEKETPLPPVSPARSVELDVVEAVEKSKVEVKTEGAGIRKVDMEIRRLVDYEITIDIPVGTYFVCRGSAQNMVGTREKAVVLRDDDWHSISISVTCANRRKDIPSEEETFDIRRSPHQKELEKLMPVLREANVAFGVQQAAVWIVTDNADYDDLGTLVVRSPVQTFGGTRAIREYEAALAMKICDEVGIDITKKAIWRDRGEILKNLDDGDLKNWLKQKSQE